MAINAFPIATVAPAANLIANTPAGSVTAIDVQSAINQLASLIPSVGPGTDPLSLTHGFSLTADNPTVSGDANDLWAARIKATYDGTNSAPQFGDSTTLEAIIVATNGQANYSAITQAKETFFSLSCSAYYNASGQKFIQNRNIQAFGMSDTALHGNDYVQFGGGPVDGDEGQAWGLVSNLTQQPFLSVTTINTLPPQTTINTTTTAAIAKSVNAQTVPVVSTAGVTDGDWVVVDQEMPTSASNMEAVKVISHSPTSITGVFRCNHNSGCTITPALRIFCDSTYQMGQDRVLVNMGPTSYSAGTVSSIAGGGFTGSGTGWSTGMVGGNALNIGAITLAADDFSGAPFNGTGQNGTLKSWYQILGPVTATSMGILRTSAAGDHAYAGKGPGTGAYVIRPCAKILRIGGSAGSVSGELICETVGNPALWAAGTPVECVICPYADVTGFMYRMSTYTNGGTNRSFLDVRNLGPRTIGAGIYFDDGGYLRSTPGADAASWNTLINMANAAYKTGIVFGQQPTVNAAIQLPGAGGGNDNCGLISWDPNPPGDLRFGIRPNATTGGFDFFGMQTSRPLTGDNLDPGLWGYKFSGQYIWMFSDVTGVQTPYIHLYKFYQQSPLQYERLYIKMDHTPFRRFRIGSENSGPSTDGGDLLLETAGTTRLRLDGHGPGITVIPTTFANLPNPLEGMVASITDSSVNTWGTTIAGGGSNHVLGYYDGTNWTVIGK